MKAPEKQPLHIHSDETVLNAEPIVGTLFSVFPKYQIVKFGAVMCLAGCAGSNSDADRVPLVDSGTSDADRVPLVDGGTPDASRVPALNLFANPSLELWAEADTPNRTPDAWDNCTIGTVAIDAMPDSCDGQPDMAAEGQRFGRGFDGEGIAQTVSTTPGAEYRISFQYTEVSGCFGGASNSQWSVLIDDEAKLVTPSDTGTTWTQGGG